MNHQARQDLIRRKFALEARLTSFTREQLSEATAERLSRSFNLTEPEAAKILETEKQRRR